VRNYGGDLAIATKASLFSEGFELVTFSGRSTIPYGIYLAGAVVSRTTSLPGVQSVITRRIELLPIDGDPVYVQVDGEAAGQLPATIDFIPSALTVLIPASAKN
jgi:diacylglycerol kinase family enzyme